jgi:two-component system sensor kinase
MTALKRMPHALAWLLAGVLTLLLANVAIPWRLMQQESAAHEVLAHSLAVIGALHAFQAALVDAETGQRGYVITGDERYLEPYHTALTAIPAAFNRLRALTADNAAQQQRLERAAPLIQLRLDALAQVMDRYRKHGFAAAAELVATDEGKRTMDSIRTIIADMLAEEYRLHAERSARAEKTARQAAIGIVSSTLLGTLLLLAAYRQLARRHAERMGAILASAMDAVIAIDARQRITIFNPAAEKMFGYTARDLHGQPLDRLLPERFRAAHREHIDRFGASGQTGREMGRLGTIFGLRADGTEFPIEASISQAGAGAEKTYTVILRDVTRRMRYENELRSLAERLIEAEETERRNINREVHDRLGQDLSAANLGLDLAGTHLAAGRGEDARRQLEEVQRLVLSSIAHARDIMAKLHPPGLEESGLGAALRELAQRTSQRTGIEIAVDDGCSGPRPAPAVEMAFYRIAQEALSNLTRHSAAKRARIALRQHGGALVLEIADDGRGFDPAAATRGHGRRTMRERALAIGAALSVESAPGAGTRVRVEALRAQA